MSADNSTSASDQQLSSQFVPRSSSKRQRIPSPEVNPPRTTIGKLGDDLLVEILIRLPNPRYASRCKAVCKGWRSLISDPIRFNRRFVSHHRSRNQQPPLLLPSDDPQSIITSFLPPMSSADRNDVAVLDSYKDLLLCGFVDGTGELSRSYFLCNPFTKQWVALPLAPERPTESSRLDTRLVCEPRISHNLDLGDAHQVFVYCPEYRFRVVRLYEHKFSTKVDVFCSDSREWTKGVVVLDGSYFVQLTGRSVVSCNGDFFSFCAVPHQGPGGIQLLRLCIAAFNPFRPDIPPTVIDVPPLGAGRNYDIAVSQGALHMVVFDQNPDQPGGSSWSTVWRLEDDRKSWRKLCVGLMKGSRLHELHGTRLKLHPGMPEVVFFTLNLFTPYDRAGPIHFVNRVKTGEVLSCNLKTGGELEVFADLINFREDWYLIQAEFSCWPTSIPSYDELRVMYDGSHSCWVQRGHDEDDEKPTTPPPSIAVEP